MKKRLLQMMVFLLAALFIAPPAIGLADAGNFGGGSDFGSGGFDAGGFDTFHNPGTDINYMPPVYNDPYNQDTDEQTDYWPDGYDNEDTEPTDYYEPDYIEDEDLDYVVGGSFFDGGFNDPFGFDPFFSSMQVIVVIIIFAVLGFFIHSLTQSAGQTASHPRTPTMDTSELKRSDPDFSEEDFIEMVGGIYVRMQAAWQSKKWSPMRPFMTDALFSRFGRQLQEYIDKGQTNHVERISVLGADIKRYSQDDVNDILTVSLRTRIIDYVTDDATGALVSGSRDRELFMEYEYTFIRRKGVKTTHDDDVYTLNCPSCGAPLNINHSSKCEYCGSIVSSGRYSWVISNIKGISQRTR